MQAYLNDPQLKADFLVGLSLHAATDHIVKGLYWENGKGCAVGCSLETLRKIKGLRTIDRSDHALYESLIGVPVALARIEDALFEALPNGHAKAWPIRFADAIAVGSDLSRVSDEWFFWLLADHEHGVVNCCGEQVEAKDAVEGMAALFRRRLSGENPSKQEWAAGATASARAAGVAWAIIAASSAAETARTAGALAIRTAEVGWAAGVARAAEEARAAWAAEAAGAGELDRRAIIQADKLIELLRGAPQPEPADA